MGQTKQTLDWQGRTLLEHAVATLRDASVEAVFVVTQPGGPTVDDATQVVCEDWGRGMGASVAAGLAAIDPTRPCVVHLCDLPLVDAAAIRSLTHAVNDGAAAAAAAFDETIGPPVAVAASQFNQMRQATSDEGGAKRWLLSLGESLARFPVEAAAWDVDTPQALEAARRRAGDR